MQPRGTRSEDCLGGEEVEQRRLEGGQGGWEEEGRQAYKVLFLPGSFPTRGPASPWPSPCPALHRTLLPRPAFSLFPEQLSEGQRAAERGEKGWESEVLPSLSQEVGHLFST